MKEDESQRERRLLSRLNVLKQATIWAGERDISCSIRNQHKNGAELRVAPDITVPDRFFLHVPDDWGFLPNGREVAKERSTWRRNLRHA
jgi:hypothetical protein